MSQGQGPDPRTLDRRESITVPWRQVANSPDVRSALRSIERYGWLPIVLGIGGHGFARGVFTYASDPFHIVEGYVFEGWPIAFAITLFEGFFAGLFAWFVYFGAIGAIAGFISAERDMAPELFKVGGYLTVLFVPVFLLGSLVMTTVTMPEAVASGLETAATAEAHADAYVVYETVQMRIVKTLEAAVWILTGFLLLPVVAELYEIDERGSVIAVLPVTVAAVFAAVIPTF